MGRVTQGEIDRRSFLTSICSSSLCVQCANKPSLAVITICSYEVNSSYFIYCCHKLLSYFSSQMGSQCMYIHNKYVGPRSGVTSLFPVFLYWPDSINFHSVYFTVINTTNPRPLRGICSSKAARLVNLRWKNPVLYGISVSARTQPWKFTIMNSKVIETSTL